MALIAKNSIATPHTQSNLKYVLIDLTKPNTYLTI